MTTSSPILAIDVGNSRIKFGFFTSGARAANGALPACLVTRVVPLAEAVPWDELRDWVEASGDAFPAGIIAGANPQGTRTVLAGWPAEWPPPAVIERATSLPIVVAVDAPEKVGIDRVLNAVAANVVRPAGRSAIIIDSGTATTVDYVTSGGAFAGGAILPGFELCARALHHYTALLPLLGVEELTTEGHEPLGRDTRAAMRSGLFWGQLGAVNELVERLSDLEPASGSDAAEAEDLQSPQEPLLLLTGGGAGLLAPHLPDARWEPQLSLQGLATAGAGNAGMRTSNIPR